MTTDCDCALFSARTSEELPFNPRYVHQVFVRTSVAVVGCLSDRVSHSETCMESEATRVGSATFTKATFPGSVQRTVMKSKICKKITGMSVPCVAMEGSEERSVDGSGGGGVTAVSGGGLDFANMGKLNVKMLVVELGATGGTVSS